MKWWIPCLLSLLMLCPAPASADARHPVLLGEESPLPLRVLTRPAATLYQDASEQTPLQGNLPTFQSYYVYTRPRGEALESGTGWYEVGRNDTGDVVGWLKAADVFEWRQAMCLTFTHPQGRLPVLLFEEQSVLDGLVAIPADQRRSSAQGYVDAIKETSPDKPLPADFPVVSVEPDTPIDLAKEFYLLPILEHRAVQMDGRDGRLLRIAAVSATERGGTDIRHDPAPTAQTENGASLEDVKIDLVWVLDTTHSMAPYIAQVRDAMRAISQNLAANPALNGKIAFGVWGYRDSTSIEGIEYVTRNFTPEPLPVDAFLQAMEAVQETAVDSVDMAEDVFAGVNDAIASTAWRPGAIRLVVLVGDAPSHEAGHQWNSSGLEENTLRALATEHKVSLLALHLNPPTSKRYNSLAARQFKALALNPGVADRSFYWGINANDVEAFGSVSREITTTVVDFMSSLGKDIPAASTVAVATASGDAPTTADIRNVLRAATLTWLGSREGAKAPRDIEAWVVDRDLADPAMQALEVRLLVTKSQLDSLSTLLKNVLEAGRKAQVGGDEFFTSLQAVAAVAARNPELLSKTPNLAQSGLIPGFLAGLPYHTPLMDMNNDLWASWSPDEQDGFLNGLEAKLKAYAALNSDPQSWKALNAGDDPAQFVAAVPLELLP